MTTGSRVTHSDNEGRGARSRQPSRVGQWTGGVCVGGMLGSDVRVSEETCDGE